MAHAGIIQAIVVRQSGEQVVITAGTRSQWADAKDHILHRGVVHKLQTRSVQKTAGEGVAQYQDSILVADVLVRQELTVVRGVGWGGEICDRPMTCQTQQCLNGGTCLDKAIGFQCLCPPEYTGELCQIAPSCAQQCPIDSECVGGKCVCKPGSSGELQFQSFMV